MKEPVEYTKLMMKTKKLISLALLAAIASVLMYLDFPLPMFPTFLKFDFSDLPALIAAFAFGPISGVAVELIKNLIHLLSTRTGGVGELANFLVGTTFCVSAGMIYMRNKTKKNAVFSLLIGIICTTAAAALANYFILFPLFKLPRDINMILSAIVPFNLLKSTFLGIITVLTYKYISHLLK